MNKNLFDLTAPQKSIFITEQYFKGSSINNICGVAFIHEVVNFDLLKKAINLVVEHNENFNIRLCMENNEIKQYVADYFPFDIEIVNVLTDEDLVNVENNFVKQVLDTNSKLFDFKLFRFPNGSGGFIPNLHHLISDSWTLGLIAKEVVGTYANLVDGKEPDFSVVSSYSNYIEAEKEYIESDKFKKDKVYWNSIFDTIPEPASIPAKKSDMDTFSCEASRITCTIPKETTESIQNFCKNANVSVFNFFMAIYAIYIGRISNLDDFVIGTPILNRCNFKEKNTMGMFINIVPYRINLQDNQTFKSFVCTIAKDSLSMLRHQKYSYQYILEDLRSKNPSLPNLYNIVMSYQITKTNLENNISYDTNWIFNGSCGDDLDIHLLDLNDTGSINIAYDYRVNKYDKEEISFMHERILHMIHQVLNHEDILLNDIDIVTNKEKYEMLYKWNETDAFYPSTDSVVSLFEKQVSSTPNNIAVCFEDKTLTYIQLNEKANQLSHFLVSSGIKNGDIVALRLNKSLEMIISILAIIKSGACYLPIDLSYPQERISFMLKDSNAKLFLTNTLHKSDLSLSIPTILVDLANNEIYTKSTENLNLNIKPEDSIYIIYTSGSTGTPKGVELSHKNIVRLLKNDHFLFDFSDKDVWTMFHSCAFDFSVWEMYGALLYGGKLILVPEVIAKNPSEFLKLLREEKVTILNQTPTYFYNLLDAEMLNPSHDLYVRYIIFGGEALNPSLIRDWKEKYSFTRLINMYGITETTVHVTFKELSDDDLLQTSSNIGVPIPTLKVYVMDRNQKLMPYGIQGEMCVAGLGLCKGYLNRPELNSSRFVKNPYNPDELLYRSADSAILLPSGELIYKGRIDNQVKIRGFRIELGEIETKLSTYSSVEKCIVLPKVVDNKDAFLVAYVICNTSTTSDELRNYISKLVPTYMIPTYFVFVDSFPLTNNGKVDRKKLLSINLTIKSSKNYVAPRNPFEIVFCEILQKTLNVNKVGIDDNILELGADSLTLMKITVELLQKNYIVNIQDIYELKTIRLIHDKINYRKKMNTMLSNNLYYTFDESFDSKRVLPDNVLLTGATGYLGIHILHDLLLHTNCTIYCLIRNKNNLSPELRLIKKLEYYFGEEILSHINNRIQIVNGDISLNCLGLSDCDYSNLGKKIDVVIHCAAIVSHYGDSTLFDNVNVNATNQVIAFCKKFDIKLNYISTTSVCAMHVNNTEINYFDEHCLYIGQNYEDNVYIKSKFEAECSVWEAMKNGLNACIYRLGNITARYSDGKFQENDTQNAFLNRIVTFTKLGKIPESFANLSIDLSPVDVCSNMIVNILTYPSSYNKVFHICNNNIISVCDLLKFINSIGKHIDIITDEQFSNFLYTLSVKDDALGIINDVTSNMSDSTSNISLKSDFTITYLNKIGLNWPIVNLSYVEKFLNKYIKGDK